MPAPDARARHLLPGALAVLAAWMLVHPYAGIRHDGVLYLGQVLHHLGLGDLHRDVFFAHGSQQDWSLYSRLMAPLYERAGIAQVSLLVLVPAHAATAVAMWMLLRPLDRELRWAGFMSLALMQHIYGGIGAMSFGENFLTARTLAEPLSLWALVAMQAARPAWAVAALGGAAALHPLVALPALAVCWLLACARDRRWIGLALLALPALALAAAGVAPFAALLRRYSPTWWALVDEVNAMVVLSHWDETDWQSVVFDFAVLLAAWRLVGGGLGRLAACIAAAVAGLLLTAALGADLLHAVLLTQLQLWRGLWLAHALALLLLPAVLLALWRTGPNGPAAALALAVMATAASLHTPTLLPVAAWAGGHLLMTRLGTPLSGPVRRLSQAVSAGLILALGALTFRLLWQTPADETAYLDISLAGKVAMAWPLAIGLAVAALLRHWPSHRAAQAAGWALAAGALLLSLQQWDRRSAWIRTVEAGLHVPHPFQAHIPPGAQVYWHADFSAAWPLLKRPSFYAKAQGAGLLFNEATAEDFGARWRLLAPLRQRRERCEALRDLASAHPPGDASCAALQEADVSMLCQRADLDFVISPNSFMRAPIAHWSVPGAQADLQHHYLYACSQFR
ncbi:MAG: hypothetical protein EKK53_08440 [Burkholderiales bacterium]|nr:MAG: hypothetical protein EKK53_08440 [Burkholderiales bacterium]